jgi:hypothetical protein
VIRSRRRDRAAVARNAAKVANRSRIVRQSSEVTYAYTRYARQRAAIRMARRPADARICRNERVVRSHIYEPISILTHGSLDLIDDRRTAFFRCSGRKSDRRLRAAGLPNGTRNYPDADRRIMRGYQARAHVGRGSLCVVLFTDWAATDAESAHCRGYLLSNVLRVLALSLPGGSQGFRMSYRPE